MEKIPVHHEKMGVYPSDRFYFFPVTIMDSSKT
jgi:hypothetical protein